MSVGCVARHDDDLLRTDEAYKSRDYENTGCILVYDVEVNIVVIINGADRGGLHAVIIEQKAGGNDEPETPFIDIPRSFVSNSAHCADHHCCI